MKLLNFIDEVNRNFKHPDGSTAYIKVSDCRVTFWHTRINGNTSKGGGTKHSIEDARSIASKKVREWLKNGFIETESTPAIQFNLNTNIIEVFRSVKSANPNDKLPLNNYLPVIDESTLYRNDVSIVNSIPWFSNFLLCSDELTKGIAFRTSQIKPRESTPNQISARDEMTNKLTLAIKQYKEEILVDNKTPVRKLPLKEKLGKFTHLAVLSPTVYNQDYPGTETIGRSVWFVFPCFDSEFNKNDSVCTGEARTKGRNSISYVKWNRDAHFVFDLKNIKDITKPEKDHFLIYEPRNLEKLLSTKALSKTKFDAIDAKNYKGEIRRFLPNQVLNETDIEEIRLFFTE